MGRLFDAVASVLGIRDEISYEGQAAIELEQLAGPDVTSYDIAVHEDGRLRIDGPGLVRDVALDRVSGMPVHLVAARFHNSIGRLVTDICTQLRQRHSMHRVALSGGVFQNARLLRQCLVGLQAAGFTVLTHHRVPTNDGGISLGQVAVAGARDRVDL